MDMASLLGYLGQAGQQLTPSQQQQLLASASASLAGHSQQDQRQSRSDQLHNSVAANSGLTPAQQQLLAAAGTSLTSLGGSQQQQLYQQQLSTSRASTPSGNHTPTGTPSTTPRPSAATTPRPPASATPTPTNGALDPASQTKYQQLLSVIEEMSKDIRPCYAGSKSSAERLKRGIVYARILVRECLVEAERSART